MADNNEIMEIVDNTPPIEPLGESAEAPETTENNDVCEQETEVQNESATNAEKSTATTSKHETSLDSDNTDSEQTCPICMDSWTNSGEHQLCCLRCGHLFGHSCISRWLQISCQNGNRRCPQCNKKAAIKDIRKLYAKKLICTDTSEMDRLKAQLNGMTKEKNRLEMELTKSSIKQQMYERQMATMKNRILELEMQRSEMSIIAQQTISQDRNMKFHLERSMEICSDGGCRVIAYNPWYCILVISQKSKNPLFSGFGLRKIDTEKFQQRQFIFLHTQPIRDIMFHPIEHSLLLSVGFDKCTRLVDVHNNVVVHSYNMDSPLWSCCWTSDNPNTFLIGTQNGAIVQFDIRQTSGPIQVLDSHMDKSPLVSMAAIPPSPNGGIATGGFIGCQLNSCFAYERRDSRYIPRLVFFDGPFMSVRYNKRDEHTLISTRPSAQHPQARHTVCTLQAGCNNLVTCDVIHTFYGGSSQQLLSRPCQINVEDDTLIAAHHESNKTIPLWSIKTGKQVYNLPVSDPVVDMCSFEANNALFLATISVKKLRLYNYSQL